MIDAYKTANLKYVPVVGADNNGFMGQEIDMKDAGSCRHQCHQSAGGRRRRTVGRA